MIILPKMENMVADFWRRIVDPIVYTPIFGIGDQILYGLASRHIDTEVCKLFGRNTIGSFSFFREYFST